MSGALEARLVGTVGALAIDVELRAAAGEALLLVGPNGAGKSTILRMLLGAHPVREGRVALAGRALFDRAAGVDLAPEARALAFVPQGSGLFPHLSVLENVRFGLDRARPRVDPAERRRRAEEALARFGIEALAARSPATLSGGERQRVALARALVTRPGALLVDEPFSALDRRARRSLRALLAEHVRALGVPAVVVTHDPEDVEALSGEVVFVEAGRVAYRGRAAGLAASGSPAVAAFLGIDDDAGEARERSS